jgi:hypothetical protein
VQTVEFLAGYYRSCARLLDYFPAEGCPSPGSAEQPVLARQVSPACYWLMARRSSVGLRVECWFQA